MQPYEVRLHDRQLLTYTTLNDEVADFRSWAKYLHELCDTDKA